MLSDFNLVGLVVSGTLLMTSPTSANDVDKLLNEIKSVWALPAFDQGNRGDPVYVQDYERRLRETLERRVDLIGDFYRIASDHPMAREFMVKRWTAMTHRLLSNRRDEFLAEVEAITAEEGHALRVDAAYYKAFLGISAARDEGPNAVLEPTEAFIAHAPQNKLGAQLLKIAADLPNTPPDLRSSIIDRIVAEYPESTVARNIKVSKRQVEGLGKPFELAFQDVTSGKAVSVQDLRGKVVVVDFWATWCGPCVAEMPKVKELYAKYKDEGVEFIGVSLDAPDEDGTKAIKSFVEINKLNWPQFHGGAASKEFADSWGISGIPTVFVIDTEGNLHSTEARGRLESLIPDLLKASAAPDVKVAKPPR